MKDPYRAKRSRPPRAMVRVTKSDSPVIELINRGMDKTFDKSMMALVHQINYPFTNLWAVYHRQRNMPIWPLWQLCKFLDYSAEDAINFHEAQPPVPRVPKKVEVEPILNRIELTIEDMTFGDE
jgi:hypothetical protein